jgi:hypothetical protein
MFEVIQNKGVHIKFENGYSVSIQWGAFNYCDNRARDVRPGLSVPASSTAETAIIYPNGKFVEYKGGPVQAYQSPAEVLETMNYASTLTYQKEEGND